MRTKRKGKGFLTSENGKSRKYIVAESFSSGFEKIRLDAGRFGVNHIESVFGEEVQNSSDGIFYIDMPEHWVKVFKCNKN